VADDAPAPPTALTPPLNLPVGSVRAKLTLVIVATTWVQLLRGVDPSVALRDTLLLVLGYYFGARAGPPAADAYAAPADRESNSGDPLYLPRGAIRLLIVVGFAAVAWKLHETHRLLDASGQPQPIFVLVSTFLLGAVAKGVASWLGHHLPDRLRELVGHLAAAGTLLVVVAHCGLEVAGKLAEAPAWATTGFLGIVGFYLGKR
jgi:hypothetical protein